MTEKNAGFVYDGFEYWLDEYFNYKVVTGSEAQCMQIFKQDIVTYPIAKYGTGVRQRGLDKNGNNYKVVIRWFKTEELYSKHLNLPPTYVRNGKAL